MSRQFILEQLGGQLELVQMVETFTQWIYRLCESNNLSLKTTELAAQLLQISYSQNFCNLKNIQLIAITSLFISVKYNESQSFIQINLQDCTLLSNGIYSEEEFLDMELQILNLIHFDLNLATITDLLKDEQQKYSDLVLFVTLDSEFWTFSKLDLFEAILQFNNNHKKDQNEITNKIINLIQTKIDQLTKNGNDEKNNFDCQTKRIQKQKFKSKKVPKTIYKKTQVKKKQKPQSDFK